MTPKTFRTERIFTASRKNVWRALTEKELMKQWYFDLPEFKAEVGFTFEVTGGEPGGEPGGTQYLHHFEIVEVIPERKLMHTCTFVGYEGISYLTYELFDKGENTKLILTHSGLETFPSDTPDFEYQNFEIGWNLILDISLKNFLEQYR